MLSYRKLAMLVPSSLMQSMASFVSQNMSGLIPVSLPIPSCYYH